MGYDTSAANRSDLAEMIASGVVGAAVSMSGGMGERRRKGKRAEGEGQQRHWAFQ
jgi:hypothetical protein